MVVWFSMPNMCYIPYICMMTVRLSVRALHLCSRLPVNCCLEGGLASLAGRWAPKGMNFLFSMILPIC